MVSKTQFELVSIAARVYTFFGLVLRTLSIIMVIACASAATENIDMKKISERYLDENHKSNNLILTKHFEKVSAKCIETGGKWFSSLLACHCLDSSFFSQSYGCQRLDPKLMTQIMQNAIHRTDHRLHTNSEKFTLPIMLFGNLPGFEPNRQDAETTFLNYIRNQIPLHDFGSSRKSIFFEIGDARVWTAGFDNDVLESILGGDIAAPILSLVDPGSTQRKLFKDGSSISCENITDQENRRICTIFNLSLKEIKITDPAFPDSHTSVLLNDESCTSVCALRRKIYTGIEKSLPMDYQSEQNNFELLIKKEEHPVEYMIIFNNLTPVVRALKLETFDGISWVMVLDASGNLQSLARNKIVSDESHVNSLKRYIEFYSLEWNILEKRLWERWGPPFLEDIIDNFLNTKNKSESVGDQSSKYPRVGLMVLDESIDLRAPFVQDSLRVNFSAIKDRYDFEESLVAWRSLRLHHHLELSGDVSRGESHGTDHIETATQDISKQVNLKFIAGCRFDVEDADLIYSNLSDLISKEKIRVLSISLGLDLKLADCFSIFDRLASSFKEQLLIVSAAGNTGLRQGGGDCMAQVAKLHSNVMLVAGADEWGNLAPDSSYGESSATVLGPMRVPVSRPRHESDSSEKSHVFTRGTSFSAPWISNIALKMILRNPDLNATDIAERLKRSCRNSNQPVECGGMVQIDHPLLNLID